MLTPRFTITRKLPVLADARVAPALKRHANDLMLKSVSVFIEEMPRDTGTAANLAQPGAGTTKVEGDPIPTRVIVGTSANRGGVSYLGALNADKRRGAGGPPPVKAIERWMRRKGIQASKKGKNAQRSLAFAIAKSIAKNGQTREFKYVGTARAGQATKEWRTRARARIEANLPAFRKALLADMVAALRG